MHLAQVGYADTVVEDLIASLERAGIYDETLIIVVADHGVAVRPGVSHRRAVTEDTIGDIAAIPLLIKRPNQGAGEIDDYRAETIDIVPTIADVLGIDLPWAAEGVSLFSDNRPMRAESRIDGSEGTIVFGTDGSEARAIAARKIEHFGGNGPFGLAPAGYRDLLGRSVEELGIRTDIGLVSTVGDRAAFRAVDLDGPSLPAWISGTVRTIELDDESVVAVALNGRVAAVTRFSEIDDGTGKYAAILRPDAFVDGQNEVIVLLVRGTGDERQLLRPGA